MFQKQGFSLSLSDKATCIPYKRGQTRLIEHGSLIDSLLYFAFPLTCPTLLEVQMPSRYHGSQPCST